MSVESFFHRRLKIGGHRWLPTVHESIVDPLDGGKEISYRAIRRCALCRCMEKDWRVADGSEIRASRSTFSPREPGADWRFSLVGLLLKPLAIVAFAVLLLVNGVSVSVQTVRGLFGVV